MPLLILIGLGLLVLYRGWVQLGVANPPAPTIGAPQALPGGNTGALPQTGPTTAVPIGLAPNGGASATSKGTAAAPMQPGDDRGAHTVAAPAHAAKTQHAAAVAQESATDNAQDDDEVAS